MKYAHCCSELEKLAHPSGAGLGLVILKKRRLRFFLGYRKYRKDWLLDFADVGIEIKFCPYCGSKLTRPSSMLDQISE
jgi:hypothetical protein